MIKPTTYKYIGRTITYYIVWSELKDYKGIKHKRTYVKRFYISGKLIKASRIVSIYHTRFNSTVKGIKVIYKNPVVGFTGKRGKTKYKVGKKYIKVIKIIPLEGAPLGKKVRITKYPPRGPLLEIN